MCFAKNICKRILSVVLTLSILILPFAFSSFRVSASESEELFFNCEKGVSVTNGTSEIVTSKHSEGCGSLKITTDSSGNFAFTCFGEKVNAAKYDSLQFDVLCDDGAVFSTMNRIGFSFDKYGTVLNDGGSYLQYTYNEFEGNLWHTVTLPIGDMVSAGIDISSFDRFVMFSDNGVWGGKSGARTFYIDNIRFSLSDEVVLYDGDRSVTEMLSCSTEISTERASRGTSSLKVTTDSSTGNFGIQTLVDGGMDASKYTYLCFDIYVENEAILRAVNRLFFQIDADESHRLEDEGNYLRMVTGATAAGKWKTVKIPLSDFAGKGANLYCIDRFSMCNDQGVWGGQEGQSFWIDNVRLTRDNQVICYDGETSASAGNGAKCSNVTDMYSEGIGSLKVTTNTRNGNFYVSIPFTHSYNGDNYANLKFDIYCENPAGLENSNNLLFMADNSHSLVDSGKYISGKSGALTANSWTTVSIPLSDFSAVGTDISSISRLYISGTTSVRGMIFWIDNICLSDCTHRDCTTTGGYAQSKWTSGSRGECYCNQCHRFVEWDSLLPAFADTNGDSFINLVDLVRMKKAVANDAVCAEETGDLDYSESVDSADLLLLKKRLLGVDDEAYAIFGSTDIYSGMQVIYSGGEPFEFSNENDLSYRAFVGNNASLSVSLDNSQRSLSNDIVVSLKYYAQESTDVYFDYLSSGNVVTEKIIGLFAPEVAYSPVAAETEGFIERNVRLSNVTYGGMSGSDFRIRADGILKIAEIHILRDGESSEGRLVTTGLFNCETQPAMDFNAQCTLVTDNFTEGSGSAKITTSPLGKFQFVYYLGYTKNISSYDSLAFDIYVENEAILRAVYRLFFQIDADESHRLEDNGKYLMYKLNATTAGAWRTIRIPLSDFCAAGVDLTNIDRFIFCNDQGVWGGQEGQSFWIDNIRLEKTLESDNLFKSPQIVDTIVSTEENVVAETSVTWFGASGTGRTDDTAAFISAIDYVWQKGGGTVFVPAGEYVVRDTLYLPPSVTLRGESDPHICDANSSVIKCYYGKGVADYYTNAAINVSYDAQIRNLTIWYPQQKLDSNPIPYSWTVFMETGSTVEDVMMLNSYRGIMISPKGNIVATVRNLYGTPIETGIYCDHNVDINRFENISFKPDYWVNNAPAFAPDSQSLKNWMQSNATAFLFERVDWTYFWDFEFDSYKIGLHGRSSTSDSTEPGTAGGQIYNARITNCNIGILIESIAGTGSDIAKSTITANAGENPVAVKFGAGFDALYNFHSCIFSSTGDNVLINNGTGSLTVMNTSFSGNSTQPVLNQNGSGEISCINSWFVGNGPHIRLSPSVKSAKFINNMTAETLRISDETGGANTKVVYNNEEIPETLVNDIPYDITYQTKPNGTAVIDASKAPYNVSVNSADVSSALQSALNAAASVGGTVYVPAGEYRLENSITVPSGVELRGSSDGMLHTADGGTTFLTDYGRGNASAQPLILLSENSGAYGFKVYHDKQNYLSPVAYPFVLQGRGSDCYIVNVKLVDAYKGIDFASYRCDRHFIMGVYGITLSNGIVIGSGSTDGVLRDCHFNPNSYLDYIVSQTGKEYLTCLNELWPYLIDHNKAFEIKNVSNETMYNNFVYGSNVGMSLSDGADVFMMGNSADGSALGIKIGDIRTGKTTWIIASQLCVSGYQNDCFIKTTSDFSGRINLINTVIFGDCADGIVLRGSGTFNIFGMGITRMWPKTTQQIDAGIGNCILSGITFTDSDPTYDILVRVDGGTPRIYGCTFKIPKSPNIKLETTGALFWTKTAEAVGSDV